MGKARAQRLQLERAKHRKLLWMAYTVIQAAFVIEFGAGLIGGSAALQLDALETADSKTVTDSVVKGPWTAKHEVTLNVMTGVFALLLSCWTIGVAVWNQVNDVVPDAIVMATAAGFIFVLNAVTFVLLLRQRLESEKLKAAWRGARNDMVGAGTVMVGAAGVWLTGRNWPDAVALALILPFAVKRAIATMRLR